MLCLVQLLQLSNLSCPGFQDLETVAPSLGVISLLRCKEERPDLDLLQIGVTFDETFRANCAGRQSFMRATPETLLGGLTATSQQDSGTPESLYSFHMTRAGEPLLRKCLWRCVCLRLGSVSQFVLSLLQSKSSQSILGTSPVRYQWGALPPTLIHFFVF